MRFIVRIFLGYIVLAMAYGVFMLAMKTIIGVL